jgi:hypothetical protein
LRERQTLNVQDGFSRIGHKLALLKATADPSAALRFAQDDSAFLEFMMTTHFGA